LKRFDANLRRIHGSKLITLLLLNCSVTHNFERMNIMATMNSGMGGPAGYGENVFSSTDKFSGSNDDGNVEIDVTSVFSGGMNFFGTTYTEIYLSGNGLITFGDSFDNDNDDGFSVIDVPALAPFYSDLNVNQGGEIYWDFDTTNGKITITFDAVEPYNYNDGSNNDDDDDGAANSFQVVLTDLGGGDFNVEYIYENIEDAFVGGDHAIAGLTDGSGRIYELEGSGDDSFMENSYATNDFDSGDQAGTFSFRTINGTPDVFAVDGTSGSDQMGLGYIDLDGDQITVGDDIVYGGANNDTIYGEGGADYIEGGSGSDRLFGGEGSDTLLGGTGNDLVNGQNGNDLIEGGAGFDNLYGNAGNDTISGGTGTDYIFGGTGADSLTGGDDADTFYVENTFGNDTVAGGEGGTDVDTINLSPSSVAVTVTYTGNEAGTITNGTDTITFTQIEQFVLTGANDSVNGSESNRPMNVDGAGGDDTITGGEDQDTLIGGAGNDSLSGGFQTDLIYGGSGNDTIDGGARSDTIYGGSGDDLIIDTATDPLSDDTIYGEAGNDTIAGGIREDLLDGGDDADTFLITDNFGNDTIVGGEGGVDFDIVDLSAVTTSINATYSSNEAGTITDGADTITFSGIEGLIATDGGDYVDGRSSNAGGRFELGAGNDTLFGTFGADSILGGSGDDWIDSWGTRNDTIDGGTGNDTLEGGAGNDLIMGGADDDSLTGWTGDDTLQGGAGNDTLNTDVGNDLLEGGDDADVFIVNENGAGDTIIGGEGGDDNDTIQMSSLGVGVNVTYSSTEAGTITGGSDTLGFTQIENIELTQLNDTVDASAATDGVYLNGLDGDDSIIGGVGNDTIFGGLGGDTIAGGDGDDFIDGGDGDDFLTTGLGRDTLIGGAGNDTLMNSDGDDSLGGGAGDDSIIATGGNDTLEGGSGDDTLDGGADNDSIEGGSGDDLILTGSGDDYADGGDGADTFVISDGFGNDTIIGGEGGVDSDTIDLNALSGAVTVTFTGDETGTISNGTHTITFSEIERLILTNQADLVVGDADSAGIDVDGREGDDSLDGGSGNDTIQGGLGDDSIDGNEGDDSLSGGDGADSIFADGGADTLDGGTGDDSLDGDAGDDSIIGGAGADTIDGGADNDTITAGTGDDNIQGGTGNDTFVYRPGDGSDTITDFNTGNTGTLDDGDNSNNDFIDLSGFYGSVFELHADQADDGVLNQSNTTGPEAVDYSDNDQFAPGEGITFTGASADNSSFTSENTGVACYAPGKLIETPEGPCAVETVAVGDMVYTLDHGPQPVRWIHSGVHALEKVDIDAKPVLIAAGALGKGLPAQDLIVSAQHRLLVGGCGQLDGWFKTEAFAPAKSLTAIPGIRHMRGKQSIAWIHFACDHHEVVIANGCLSESLLLGPLVMNELPHIERKALANIFGPVSTPEEALNGPPARECLKVGEVRRHLAECKKEHRRRTAKEIKKWGADLAMEKWEADQLRLTRSKVQYPNLRRVS